MKKQFCFYLLQVLALALAYWLLAYGGHYFAPQYLHVTAIWYPYGLTLALFLVYGSKLWPGAFLGSLLFTQIIGVPLFPALISAFGDSLAPVLGVWLMKKMCKIDLRLASFHDALGIIIFGSFLPPFLCGVVGTFSLYVGQLAPLSKLPETMMVWWLSDVAGSITLTPLIISCLIPGPKPESRPSRKIELFCLFFLLSVVSWTLYARGFDVRLSHMLPLYANLVFAVWAALRFDLKITMLVTAIAGLAALIGSILTLPQVEVYERGINILHLQILTGSISAIGLLLSAATRQQQEITETLRKSINKYLASEERLELALEAAHMGTWSWETSGEQVIWSDEVEKIFGLQKGQFKGTLDGFLELIYPPDLEHAKKTISEALTVPVNHYKLEHRVKFSDGTLHWIEATGQVLRDKKGNPYKMTGVVCDITERKELSSIRESLLLQEKKARLGAEKSIEQRDEFLSVASHELKTPLTAVLLSIQMALRQIEDKNSPVVKNLETAESSLNRFLKLVSNLLDVSRITAERLSITPQKFDLSLLLQEIIDRLRPEFSNSGSTVETQINPNIEGEWDMIRIEQVIMNILTNAIKYGMGRPIHITLTKTASEAILTVMDQGIGIAEGDRKKIFERFERVAPQKQYGGLGLGLFITKNIVEAHRGKISVDSNPQGGSQFIVTLPLK